MQQYKQNPQKHIPHTNPTYEPYDPKYVYHSTAIDSNRVDQLLDINLARSNSQPYWYAS